ncbi:MAG TPA: S-layer homology domain-containing protein [Thermoanaerobaculia bacterium]|nr:S-layer homology domain-containing protein [Thermoanaerobaculia bacterium]
MKLDRSRALVLPLALLIGLLAGAGDGLLGICGPFTDVAADVFCPFVLEIFYLGITTGTTSTTYDPASNVSRLQMAAFLSRTVDGALGRGSRRAALDQFWTSQNDSAFGLTTLNTATTPSGMIRSDGADLWVANRGGMVSRVRGSDGKLLETWTGATMGFGVLTAMGRVLVGGGTNPGNLYEIDPSQPAGAVSTVASSLGNSPFEIAFDGSRVWMANIDGTLSIVTPGAAIPWTATTVTSGLSTLRGLLYDGSNIWAANQVPGRLLQLDPAGAVLNTVVVGLNAGFPIFDGANIWVPNSSDDSVSVVRASSGVVLATLTGNGLSSPQVAAFDGQRVLVTNNLTGADRVSLWKAADLTPLGSFSTGAGTKPFGAASDGVHFWIVLAPVNKLARF